MELGGWEVLSLAAIAEQDETIAIGDNEFHLRRAGEALHPELESLESLERLRREIGSDVFAAQYQQSPVPPGGAMIRREWLRYYDLLPERTYRARIIQSWDTASKDGAQNDWSICTIWMLLDGHYYLIDLVRGRYEYPRLKETAIALAQKYRPHCVLIEDASTAPRSRKSSRALILAEPCGSFRSSATKSAGSMSTRRSSRLVVCSFLRTRRFCLSLRRNC
jgi:phage terminase large subunit-like protein